MKPLRQLSLLAFGALAYVGCERRQLVPKPPLATSPSAAASASSYVAKRPGPLPQTSEPTVAGIRLPAGRLVAPDPEFARRGSKSTPVLWITAKPVHDAGSLWAKLAAEFHTTGLWPLVLESLNGYDERPWLAGELDPGASSDAGKHDAASVLANWWREVIPDEAETREAFDRLLPYGTEFPGLAPVSESPRDTDALVRVARELEGRLGLVAVSRPADALSVLGWLGPVNHFSDTGRLSAVLRSWEDRYGAYLVGVGFNTITLAVERPPRSTQAATHTAAEHLAACPDNIYQGVGSIKRYASELKGQNAWDFWWD